MDDHRFQEFWPIVNWEPREDDGVGPRLSGHWTTSFTDTFEPERVCAVLDRTRGAPCELVPRRRCRPSLDSGEEELHWQFTSRRTGHSLSKAVVRMVYDFYVAHPSIKRSPIAGDVLKIK